jgi:carbamoyl-phosphate synthase large subunit
MKTLLITAIGGDIAQSVARLARAALPESRIVGTDMHREHGGALLVDRFVQLPGATSADYVQALTALVREERVDCIVPMAEAELVVLLPLIEGRALATWVTPGASVVRAGVDKLETARALAALGIPTPWTIPVSEPPRAFPCILKNRFGSGSRAVFRVADREDAAYLAARHPQAVYQELLEPDEREVTCAVYRTADGRVATLQLRRRLMGGFTGWAEVIDEPAVTAMCARAAAGLDLRGSMNVQLRLTAAGPRIFEINPRFSSTVLMRSAIGYTDVAWALHELRGGRVEFPPMPVGAVVVRTQDARAVPPQRST